MNGGEHRKGVTRLFHLTKLDKLVLALIVRLLEVSANGLPEQAKLKIAFTMLIALLLTKQNIIYIENQIFISGLSQDEIIKNCVLEALYKRLLYEKTKNISVLELLLSYHFYRTSRGRHSILQNL